MDLPGVARRRAKLRGRTYTMAKRKKYEQIAEHLELSIVSGKLKVGERIASERDLMEQFQAGRSSVREALFTLQRKGLLSTTAGAVPRVAAPTADLMVRELSGIARLMLTRPDGVRELQEARSLFEEGLARQAAKVATDAQIVALSQALADNEAAADSETFIATDIAFHTAIARCCNNQCYLAVGAAFTEWLQEQRAVSARAGVTREKAIAEHRAIFDAIAVRDHAAAADAMAAHLRTVATYFWRGATGASG